MRFHFLLFDADPGNEPRVLDTNFFLQECFDATVP